MSPKPNETNRSIPENSNLTLHSSIVAEPAFLKLSWCFVGANGHHVCCSCDDQCYETEWTITKSTYDCGCEYNSTLTVNSVSMKYNHGTFYSIVTYVHNETFAVTHITVTSNSHKSHLVYFIIGSAAVIVVMIFLAIGIVCNIKERGHCSRKKDYRLIHHSEEQTSSPTRKEIILCTSIIINYDKQFASHSTVYVCIICYMLACVCVVCNVTMKTST